MQIETFLAVVETKSLSRAAERLYLSQPTVSYRLKSLEDELGFPLLERSKGYRTIELTTRGKSFVSIAARWMQLWQDIRLLSASDSKLPLNLSCTNSISTYLLSPLFKALASSGTLFDLTIQNHDTAGIYRAVEAHDSDVGLAYEYVSSKNLLVEPLFSERMYLVRLCADPNEIRTAYHPAELRVEDELYLNSSSSYQAWHDKWWDASARPYVNVSTESLLLDFMDNPRFWAVVPASVVGTFRRRENFKVYELLHPPEDRVCYRITNRVPSESRKKNIQLFNDCLRSFIQKQDFCTVLP